MAKTTTGKVTRVLLKSNPEQQYNVVEQTKEKVVLNPVGTDTNIEFTPKEFIREFNIAEVKMDETPIPQKAAPSTTPQTVREGTKSEAIRKLLDEGKTVAEAAKATNSHYSFVWGIAQRHFKGDVPTANKTKTDSVSQKIRDLYDEGKTKSEIKKALLVDYSFVYSVVSAYERKLGKTQPEVVDGEQA